MTFEWARDRRRLLYIRLALGLCYRVGKLVGDDLAAFGTARLS
jgi:hypothetical protein